MDLKLTNLDSSEMWRLNQLALNKITPRVRQLMLAKFRASGIKTRSGGLYRAISRVTLRLSKKGFIIIEFDPSTPAKVIIQANSLNYGAIHTPQKIGQRAKRSIKTAYEKNEAVKKKTLAAVDQRRHSNGPVSRGEIDLGAVKYRKGVKFFNLTPGEKQIVQAWHLEALNDYLEAKLKAAA